MASAAKVDLELTFKIEAREKNEALCISFNNKSISIRNRYYTQPPYGTYFNLYVYVTVGRKYPSKAIPFRLKKGALAASKDGSYNTWVRTNIYNVIISALQEDQALASKIKTLLSEATKNSAKQVLDFVIEQILEGDDLKPSKKKTKATRKRKAVTSALKFNPCELFEKSIKITIKQYPSYQFYIGTKYRQDRLGNNFPMVIFRLTKGGRDATQKTIALIKNVPQEKAVLKWIKRNAFVAFKQVAASVATKTGSLFSEQGIELLRAELAAYFNNASELKSLVYPVTFKQAADSKKIKEKGAPVPKRAKRKKSKLVPGGAGGAGAAAAANSVATVVPLSDFKYKLGTNETNDMFLAVLSERHNLGFVFYVYLDVKKQKLILDVFDSKRRILEQDLGRGLARYALEINRTKTAEEYNKLVVLDILQPIYDHLLFNQMFLIKLNNGIKAHGELFNPTNIIISLLNSSVFRHGVFASRMVKKAALIRRKNTDRSQATTVMPSFSREETNYVNMILGADDLNYKDTLLNVDLTGKNIGEEGEDTAPDLSDQIPACHLSKDQCKVFAAAAIEVDKTLKTKHGQSATVIYPKIIKEGEMNLAEIARMLGVVAPAVPSA